MTWAYRKFGCFLLYLYNIIVKKKKSIINLLGTVNHTILDNSSIYYKQCVNRRLFEKKNPNNLVCE